MIGWRKILWLVRGKQGYLVKENRVAGWRKTGWLVGEKQGGWIQRKDGRIEGNMDV